MNAADGEIYTFEEIKTAVYHQLIDCHCNYKYLTEVIWPMLRQEKLRQSFPAILWRMKNTASCTLVLGISKLIDQTKGRHLIHFKKFLIRARHTSPDKLKRPDEFDAFLSKAHEFVDDLPELNRLMSPLRNRYYAHLAPAKPEGPDTNTWGYWKSQLDRMTDIYHQYEKAANDTEIAHFCTIEMLNEPKAFLKWCRLDDFAGHRRLAHERR